MPTGQMGTPGVDVAARAGSTAGRRLSPIKVVAFSLLPVVLLLVGAEIGLRVWSHYFRTTYERYNARAGRLELVPNIRQTTPRGHEFQINSLGFLGPEFAPRKPPRTYRVFSIGDSCTFGSGVWRLAYPAMAQAGLDGASLDGRFEVINAGIEGYNSEFALDRIRTELLDYGPDMVTVYIGWNDLMKVDPRDAAATGRFVRLARLMGQSYLAKAYAKVLFYHIRPRLMKPKVGPDPAGAREFETFVPLRFQENLQEIVRTLKEHAVVPILVTLPTVVTPDMTADDLEKANVFFPYYAGGYSVQAFLGLHRAYNEVIRRTSVRERVLLVDLDAVFNERNKRELFWDTMHPSANGHRLIAEELVRTIGEVVRTPVVGDEHASRHPWYLGLRRPGA